MARRISDEFLSELNSRTDITDLISSYVDLKGRGSRSVGLCPFHNEKTGSFTVFSDTNSYYCFGCGAGGGPVTFIRQIENLDFFEAVKLLADRVGLEVPTDTFDDSYAKLKKRILEINREAARFYHTYLYSSGGKKVLDYFISRKLTDKTIKHFGLGAAPDAWDELLKHLKAKGYTISEMLAANVIKQNSRGGYYDQFRNRAMFPIIDLRGNVIAFGGRALPGDDKKGMKYINTSDTPVFKKSQNLYALNFAKNCCSKQILLAEGYMDVIALHQAGIENAVAALGTAFTEEHAVLLSRYTGEIVLTLDADGAGKKATERALSILSKSGLPVKVLSVPDGKDPDEFIKNKGANGATAFRDLINTSLNSIEYKIIEAANGIDIKTDNGRLEYLKRCAEILASIRDDIAIDLYAGKLAEKFNISKAAILSQVQSKKRQNYKKAEKKQFETIVRQNTSKDDVNPEKARNLRAAKAEEEIISILIFNPDLLKVVEENIDESTFVTQFNKRVYSRVLEVLREGHTFDVSMLAGEFTPKECGRVSMYQNRMVKGENAKNELMDCIKVLKAEKKLKESDSGALSDEEWAKSIKEIAKNKK